LIILGHYNAGCIDGIQVESNFKVTDGRMPAIGWYANRTQVSDEEEEFCCWWPEENGK